MRPVTSGEHVQLIASDPEVRADHFAPALWVPLSRVVRARRRVSTMLGRLPDEWWEGDSACPGWRRRDVLVHLLAWDGQHLRSLDAVLAGSALDSAAWVPDDSDHKLSRADWDALSIDGSRQAPLTDLADRFARGLEELLTRWSSFSVDQLLQGYGFAPNGLAAVESLIGHVDGHADDIVNGPTMLR